MAKNDPKSIINKVMNNPELRQLLFGLAATYLAVFWVLPFLMGVIKKITGWNI